jgi:hypothetical protein
LHEHQLHEVNLAGSLNAGKATIAALNGQRELIGLYVDGIGMDDEDLAAFPLDQLLALSIRRTQITATGLESLPRCRRLYRLAIDGEQLNEQSATTMRSLPTLQQLHIGEPVTDEQVRLLHGMTQLELATFGKNATVTEKAMKDLERSIPGSSVYLY